MKICYLVTSLESGGAEAAIPRIVRVIEGCGHAVQVVALEPRDRGNVPTLERAGIPFRILFARHPGVVAAIRAVTALLRAEPPDLIWTSLSAATLVGSLAGARLGIPVVSWKHSASIKLPVRLVRGLSQLWVTDSRSVTRYLVERMRVPAERILQWSIYESAPAAVLPSAWQTGTPLQIGSVGRLHPVKGYDDLIAATRRLLQARPALAGRLAVRIVGDGPQRRALEAAIRAAGLEGVVQLPGATDAVPTFLTSLHLYVQPSHYEGMCLAVHEAMSAGLPVLATPVGEVRESLAASGGGVLLDPADVAGSLAREIAALVDHPERLRAMGEKGRAYVQAVYSPEAFTAAGRRVVRRAEEIVRAWPHRHGSPLARE